MKKHFSSARARALSAFSALKFFKPQRTLNKIHTKHAKIFLFVFFVFIRFSLISQTSKADSLLSLIKTLNNPSTSTSTSTFTRDTSLVSALNALSWELKSIGDYEKAMQYASDALTLCDKLLQLNTKHSELNTKHSELNTKHSELNTKKATAYNNIGNIYYKQGNYAKALENYFASLKTAEAVLSAAKNLSEKQDAQKGIAASYNNIGNIYYEQGNYDKALENHFASLKIKEKIEDKKGIAMSYNNIGTIYKEQGNYDKALENYFACLKIMEEMGNKQVIATSYNNIGIIYKEQGNYDKALENYFASLKIREELGDKKGIAMSYNNIGIIYNKQGNYAQALENYFASLKIKEEIGDKKGIAISYNNIGIVFTEEKKYSEAKEYLNKGLKLSKEIGSKEWTKLAYESLSQLDSVQGNWKGAYEYHQLYSAIKDSMFNEESSKQIAEMQTKYESEKKELQIENLNKDNAIKETEIKKQNIQKIAFASGFALMLILAFVIFRGYKQKQKANEIISAQKTEVEKQKEIVVQKNTSLEVAYKHIEEKNTEILDSIRYAKRIQEAILPPQKLVKSYLENSFILYKPKDIVAGDFYWLAHPQPLPLGGDISAGDKVLPNGEDLGGAGILFACCDCTGHGVPGAFVSIVAHNALNRAVKEFGLTQPAKILDKVNELVEEGFSKSENDIKDGMDIALVRITNMNEFTNEEFANSQIRNDSLSVQLQYAGAGNSLYHIRENNLIEYKADKQPIGKFSNRKPFANHEIELQKNDSVYVFTDGYADQFGGPKGKKFKYAQFEKLLVSIQDRTMEEQREILNKTIDEWRGEMEQIDDICIIGVRV